MVNFQPLHNFHRISEQNFTFSPLEQEVMEAAKPLYKTMIGNSQTFTKHNTVKFKNWLPSGQAQFYQKLHKNSDFRLLSDITVDQYRSDKSETI